MLRYRSPNGWFLIPHPEHARVAGEFARAWGNDRFRTPFPRADVIEGVARHDDGWAVRDQKPLLTREGRPSAFGVDLVGKYSAFEEIDLEDYLGVRGRAMEVVAETNPYAAILISMHTCNLLTAHADRTTIKAADLPKLDAFIDRQRLRQAELIGVCAASGRFAGRDVTPPTLVENFRVLQACDNMSLLSCVDYGGRATLLHPLPLNDGGTAEVTVQRVAERTFRLEPWPMNVPRLAIDIAGRPITGEFFSDASEIQRQYSAAPQQTLTITLTS
jgi:hypothetical protein